MMTAQEGIRLMLKPIEDHLDEETIRNTPGRVVRAFREMTAGYGERPKHILAKTFPVAPQGQIVVVRGIRFVSLCAHHLLPFVGRATVGYLPKNRVVGLSKIPRLVECHARRLQLQETMGHDIAEDIWVHLEAEAVGVVLIASHSCMSCRGVRQADAEMVTSVMLGRFLDEEGARAEFLRLAGAHEIR